LYEDEKKNALEKMKADNIIIKGLEKEIE